MRIFSVLFDRLSMTLASARWPVAEATRAKKSSRVGVGLNATLT